MCLLLFVTVGGVVFGGSVIWWVFLRISVLGWVRRFASRLCCG